MAATAFPQRVMGAICVAFQNNAHPTTAVARFHGITDALKSKKSGDMNSPIPTWSKMQPIAPARGRSKAKIATLISPKAINHEKKGAIGSANRLACPSKLRVIIGHSGENILCTPAQNHSAIKYHRHAIRRSELLHPKINIAIEINCG